MYFWRISNAKLKASSDRQSMIVYWLVEWFTFTRTKPHFWFLTWIFTDSAAESCILSGFNSLYPLLLKQTFKGINIFLSKLPFEESKFPEMNYETLNNCCTSFVSQFQFCSASKVFGNAFKLRAMCLVWRENFLMISNAWRSEAWAIWFR